MGLMDLKQRKSFGKSDMKEKCCEDCKTTKTPLWRSGPAGPKSLCNACGIRNRKNRRASMALKNTNQLEKKEKKSTAADKTAGCSSFSTTVQGISSPSVENELNKSSSSLKLRFMVSGNEVLIKRAPFLSSVAPVVKKQRCQTNRNRILGEEEEQAAYSLMALSCASVFA